MSQPEEYKNAELIVDALAQQSADFATKIKAAAERQIDLQCALCLSDKPKSPVSACPNGHPFCASCLYPWATQKREVSIQTDETGCNPVVDIFDGPYKCPTCNEKAHYFGIECYPRIPSLPSVDTDVCPHCACDVAREDGQHVFDCPEETVPCPQCNHRVPIRLLGDHVDNDCDQFSCKQCTDDTLRFTLRRLELHVQGHSVMIETPGPNYLVL